MFHAAYLENGVHFITEGAAVHHEEKLDFPEADLRVARGGDGPARRAQGGVGVRVARG